MEFIDWAILNTLISLMFGVYGIHARIGLTMAIPNAIGALGFYMLAAIG